MFYKVLRCFWACWWVWWWTKLVLGQNNAKEHPFLTKRDRKIGTLTNPVVLRNTDQHCHVVGHTFQPSFYLVESAGWAGPFKCSICTAINVRSFASLGREVPDLADAIASCTAHADFVSWNASYLNAAWDRQNSSRGTNRTIETGKEGRGIK